MIEDGSIVGYKVNLAITFVMEGAPGTQNIGPEDAAGQPQGA